MKLDKLSTIDKFKWLQKATSEIYEEIKEKVASCGVAHLYYMWNLIIFTLIELLGYLLVEQKVEI